MTKRTCRREEALFNTIKYGENYIQGSTTLLGLFAIAYGALTFAFGDKLWLPSASVYRNAMEIPGAPQTWGVIATVSGVGLIAAVYMRDTQLSQRVKLASASMMSIWCFSFAFTVLIDCFEFSTPQGLPAVLILGVFWLMYVNQAFFAWNRLHNPIDRKPEGCVENERSLDSTE